MKLLKNLLVIAFIIPCLPFMLASEYNKADRRKRR